ncbi:MAG: hypothetical protein DRI44_08690 [Chlamydiae bacterium]|nr:MAG: hypothetical protein DRI44_08690 [Chlamydiota bacterium]
MQVTENIYEGTGKEKPFILSEWFRGALSEFKEAIRGKAIFLSSVFIPLKEKWFKDYHKYGALITKPQQTGDNLSEIRQRVKCDRRVKWITGAEFHKIQNLPEQ